MLTKDLFDQIVAVMLPEMDDAQVRKALVESALYGCSVLQKIRWDGPARSFTSQLARLLDEFGEIEKDRPAIVAVLEEVRAQVGADRQKQIDDLVVKLKAPLAMREIHPPPRTFPEDELYVFISYARPDQAIAEKVEAFLTAAGARVFRDTSDIGAGANWDMTIERALRECHCMALLLSPASMPDRKEVHREWFNFDQKSKTIYPLYIRDCELHSRFDSRKYIDARNDLQDALDRLLKDMRRDFPSNVHAPSFTEVSSNSLPTALQSLWDKIQTVESGVNLTEEEANQIKDHRPADLTQFRLCRIAEWSLPRYCLDERFVNLTLLLDKGESEQQRWQRVPESADFRLNDLRDVMEKTRNDPALALLGAPGSGKSTLLRRLQLDHSVDRLRDGVEQVSFFVQLNGYRARPNGESPDPLEWLSSRWAALYPQLPRLETFLQQGRALLLLDALNEMPHKNTADYHRLVELWRAFTQEAARQGNRIIFSCRGLDYSASLSSPDLRVPQVEVQPMNAEQTRDFLRAYAAGHEERIWSELDGSPQFTLFQTPYFLKLLCDQVEAEGAVPKGRAALFTGFVRQALQREIKGKLFQLEGGLLVESDHQKLSLNKWRNPFDLPERGPLIPALSDLAYAMQVRGLETEGAQVRIDYDDACDLISHAQAEDILKAGTALNALDKDLTQYEIAFFHQLLQEYFAARRLAKEPKPELVHVEWSADKVSPALEETLAGLADGDPLPPLPQTGWEETTLTACPMSKDPQAFIREMIPHNLPLAARCAASPEVKISDDLKIEIQQALIARAEDMNADLRARISAGEALGLIGDPRFELRKGPYGDYLEPPLVDIPGGTYPMGNDDSDNAREKPAHMVELAPFQIGRFPVTNAEYKCFIEAGGYEDPQWWDTEESRAWLNGEASTEGIKQQWRDIRKIYQGWGEDYIRDLVRQNRLTSELAEHWIERCKWTDEEYEARLEEGYPADKLYRQPEFWDDSGFNNPSQPVIGINWFEARAYCNWLTANACSDSNEIYRLPTEAEFEAAARGMEGRMYPYGKTFDVKRSNTFESHIQHTTPVGIFDNAMPEGAVDLSGNANAWTLSIYDQERFPYPYMRDDGREDIHKTDVRRVLRGGAYLLGLIHARAVYRDFIHPAVRSDNIGFRVVVVSRPPSH
jgi:formylglycine-generating enzyme required for sulfatase activity